MIVSSKVEIERDQPITAEEFISIGRDLVDVSTQIFGRTPELNLKLSYGLASGGVRIRAVSEKKFCKRWAEINGTNALCAAARIEHPRDKNEVILSIDPADKRKLSIRVCIPYSAAKDTVLTQIAGQLAQALRCEVA